MNANPFIGINIPLLVYICAIHLYTSVCRSCMYVHMHLLSYKYNINLMLLLFSVVFHCCFLCMTIVTYC